LLLDAYYTLHLLVGNDVMQFSLSKTPPNMTPYDPVIQECLNTFQKRHQIDPPQEYRAMLVMDVGLAEEEE
jgi:hypothetical protein